MAWQPGQSGNLKGRPPGKRALTEILRRSGSKTYTDVDGKRRAGKAIVARALWQIAATGSALLPDKDGGEDSVPRLVEISSLDEWFTVVKWLYAQIDGPPRQELDVSASGSVMVSMVEAIAALQEAEKVLQGQDESED